MKSRRIPDYTYCRHVTLIIGTDAELERWVKRQQRTCPELGDWGGVAGRFLKFPDTHGRWQRFILISTKTKGHWRTAVLAHEVMHLTFDVLWSAGLQLNEGSEEAFTYYFQGRFAECLKLL